jgi:hypothetical protein
MKTRPKFIVVAGARPNFHEDCAHYGVVWEEQHYLR